MSELERYERWLRGIRHSNEVSIQRWDEEKKRFVCSLGHVVRVSTEIEVQPVAVQGSLLYFNKETGLQIGKGGQAIVPVVLRIGFDRGVGYFMSSQHPQVKRKEN